MNTYKLVYRPLEGGRIKRCISYLGLDPDSELFTDQLAAIEAQERAPSWLPYIKKVGCLIEVALRIGIKDIDGAVSALRDYEEGCDPTEYAYSKCHMPFHVGLLIGDKLFEYEDDDQFYNGYKTFKKQYNSMISWQDFCPNSSDKNICGKTNITPDQLDAFIKKNKGWSTEGHYKLFSHNCQHFTHFCVDFIKGK